MLKKVFLFLLCLAAVSLFTMPVKAEETKDLGKVLVVYYSLSGNTKYIAEKIKEKTNADMYEVHTEEEYPGLPLLFYTAKKQTKPKNYPKLIGELPDFEKYDLIFAGFPVWWYGVSAPGLAFLDKADFKGKTVIAFATHGGNYGDYFEDFGKLAKNAKVVRGEDFKKPLKDTTANIDLKINNWFDNLGI